MSRRAFAVSILLALSLSASALPARGQLPTGQYADEAPLRTWNAFPAASAAAWGRGSVALAWADGGFSAWSNPALLAALPGSTLSLSISSEMAQCDRFSLVNTGVVSSEGAMWASVFLPDGLAAAFRWQGWTFAAAAGAWESYGRPAVLIEESRAGSTSYRFSFDQSGLLWAGTLSAARRLGRLSLGLSLHGLWGSLARRYNESWLWDGFELADEKTMTFRGLVPQAGLAWDASPRWTLGATFRGAWSKASRASSLVSFAAVGGGTVSIPGSSADDFYDQPWIAGAGACFRPSPGLTLAADALWFGWSGRAIRVFGEEESRDFRDVLRLSLGTEWKSDIRLFGRRFDYPLRLGLIYDPQPGGDPRSAYLDLTFGSGLAWRGYRIDLGGLIGREIRGGSGLYVRRIGLSFAADF